MKNLRDELAQMQATLEIYEIGTGTLKFSIPLNFSASADSVQWSSDGKYLAVGSTSMQGLKVLMTDKDSQENMWTLIDQLKHEPDFWNNFQIDLTQKPTLPKFDRSFGYNQTLETISNMWPQDKSGVIYKEQGPSSQRLAQTQKEADVKLLAELKVTQGKLEKLHGGLVHGPQHIKWKDISEKSFMNSIQGSQKNSQGSIAEKSSQGSPPKVATKHEHVHVTAQKAQDVMANLNQATHGPSKSALDEYQDPI